LTARLLYVIFAAPLRNGSEPINSYTIANPILPREDRPRERLVRHGPQALSTEELLAIILRTGTEDRSARDLADDVIRRCKGLRGLARASVKEISRIKGVGPVRGLQIAASVELGRRLSSKVIDLPCHIHSPEDVADLLLPELAGEKKEHFKTLVLDTKNRVVRNVTISVGTLDASLVHPREVFREAVQASASSVIVAHNHPSGDPTPSAEDKQVTTRLVEAGKVLGIDVLDHIVIGDDRWVSLKQLGMM
jgi:DNA repair protein RadC